MFRIKVKGLESQILAGFDTSTSIGVLVHAP